MKLIKKRVGNRDRVSSSIYKSTKAELKKYAEIKKLSQSKYIEKAVIKQIIRDRKIYK